MKLLAITNPAFSPDEAELINSLFREGLACLHIRKPESNANEYRALISKINPEYLQKIALHQHHHLAPAFGITRFHFTEKDRRHMAAETLKTLKSANYILSTSIHNLADMDHLSPHFDYTYFGPVFDSISKPGYKGVVPQQFYIKPEMKKIPVIGLGGISRENLRAVREMNFDGAAVLGVLWNEPEKAITTFRELRNEVDLLNDHGY